MSDRRTRLLEAAADLFTRYGFRKTSVEDITRTARVSKGALYLEFGGKDDLFEALMRHELRTYLADAGTRIMADPDGGRLSRIYHHSIHALLRRPFLRAIYTQDDQVTGGILQRNGPARYRNRVLLGAEFLARMQQAGLVRSDTPPDTLSHTLSLLTVGPLLAEPILHTDDSPTLDAAFDALSHMIVAAYELPEGDVDEGHRAIAALLHEVDAALSDDIDPSPAVDRPRTARAGGTPDTQGRNAVDGA